jgi:hypothetical protein
LPTQFSKNLVCTDNKTPTRQTHTHGTHTSNTYKSRESLQSTGHWPLVRSVAVPAAVDAATLGLARRFVQGAGGAPWNRSKLMLVGQGGAGKTGFCHALRGKEFKGVKSTIGVETWKLDSTQVNTADGAVWREDTACGSELRRATARLAALRMKHPQLANGTVVALCVLR